MLEFKLKDTSVYKLEDETWEKALKYKCGIEGLDLGKYFEMFEQGFAEVVDGYWESKIVPTKLGDETWDNEYKNQAELAQDVMYDYIRPALMGIILGKASNNELFVVGVQSDGANIRYDENGAKVLTKSNIEEN